MGAFGGPDARVGGVAPVISAQPQSQSSCLSQGVTLSVTAAGPEPIAYQWYFNGTVLSGATNRDLSLTNLQSSQAGPYWVLVSNPFGSVTSDQAHLVVYDACIDLRMYAGMTISGQAGSTYVLSYNTDLSNTNGWLPLATNTIGNSDWFYLDMDSPFSPKRFYKAVLQK